MAGIGPISAVGPGALSGIRETSDAVDRTARSIVTNGLAADTVTISPEARALANSSAGGDPLVSNMVDLDVEKNTLAAQVKVVQTADEMTQDLLGIVSK